MGARIGYIRTSSEGQNQDRQLDGVTVEKVFADTVSGKDTNRPELGHGGYVSVDAATGSWNAIPLASGEVVSRGGCPT
jgi:hypothetical protein